jgi:hypothetical protein
MCQLWSASPITPCPVISRTTMGDRPIPLRHVPRKSGSSFGEGGDKTIITCLPSQLEVKKYSESTVLSHFSWESRIFWTLYFYSKWFACKMAAQRNYILRKFPRTQWKSKNILKAQSCPIFHGDHGTTGRTILVSSDLRAKLAKLMKNTL